MHEQKPTNETAKMKYTDVVCQKIKGAIEIVRTNTFIIERTNTFIIELYKVLNLHYFKT